MVNAMVFDQSGNGGNHAFFNANTGDVWEYGDHCNFRNPYKVREPGKDHGRLKKIANDRNGAKTNQRYPGLFIPCLPQRFSGFRQHHFQGRPYMSLHQLPAMRGCLSRQ